MSDHQRETAFLRQCIHYDDTAERHKLDERLTQAQRDERCVRCAVWLMALLTALAMAGLCYSAVFLADFPQNKSYLTIKVLGALGLASLISLLAFVGFWVVHRQELDQRREECRRLAMKLFESRLGQRHAKPLLGVLNDRENVAK
jgi:formate hydrogenlyase subunit 3/multisubunit Na+/H+ antiporter MnhD subunit